MRGTLSCKGCSPLRENGPPHRHQRKCCAWCADYVRRGGTGNAGGPLAARIVGIANRRMCDIHCHKVHSILCPMPLPSVPTFEVDPACTSAYIEPALDCSGCALGGRADPAGDICYGRNTGL